jgi:outer membrane receptor protein involved in Fe transport
MLSTVLILVMLGLGAPDGGEAIEKDADDSPSGVPANTVWHERIVVTSARTEQDAGDVAAHVTVLERADVERSAALAVDDLLRQVPGFSLLRRSSSVVAHPTTQGVSLRGIGPSGASRTLVLLDGVPLNDPFGGWVYWSQVPLAAVERIEVVRGGGSSLWGNQALGGAIHLLTARPSAHTLRFHGAAGNRGTADADLFASEVWGRFGAAVEASFFDTGGYPVVREDQRGAIDENADSSHRNLDLQLAADLSPSARLTLRGRTFDEDRGNGTPRTGNATESGSLTLRATLRTPEAGDWELTLSATDQSFASTFSSQAPDRSSEQPALDQFDVEAADRLAGVSWTRELPGGGGGKGHLLTAGSDWRSTDGTTREDFRFLDGAFTRRRRAGGEQQAWGVYLQDAIAVSDRWQVVVGGRVDRWRSLDGGRFERSLETGEPVRDESFGDRSRTTFNPRLALLFHATPRLALRASAYRSFRAPTINELFRPFRVRNDVTEANAGLEPERLTGAEAGATWQARTWRAQLDAFWNQVDDPVANVTLAPGPGVIDPCGFVPDGGLCRQRRNLGTTRIRGVEAELGLRPAASWELTASYLWDGAEVVGAPEQPALEGRRIAQVPEHQLVLRLDYRSPAARFAASLQGRWTSEQFEDDLNTLALGDLAVADLALSHRLRSRWEVFLRVENLFGETYEAGRTADGLVTVGAPALVHGGLRVRIPSPH